MINLIQGDCLEKMKDIPDKSIDMVLCDPPYGITSCKWDIVIPLDLMWNELKRITKDNGAIVLFGSEPFSSHLRLSNLKMFKYDWIWDKVKGANFVQANKRPLNSFEIISIFASKQTVYNPQKTTNPKGIEKRSLSPLSKQKKVFEGQVSTTHEYSKYSKSYEPDKLLPRAILNFSRQSKPVHPTQKPVALLEYLIKTYTLENETVLDFTMGSGSTGVACKNLNRKFIGIEKDENYFQIAKNRIESQMVTLELMHG